MFIRCFVLSVNFIIINSFVLHVYPISLSINPTQLLLGCTFFAKACILMPYHDSLISIIFVSFCLYVFVLCFSIVLSSPSLTAWSIFCSGFQLKHMISYNEFNTSVLMLFPRPTGNNVYFYNACCYFLMHYCVSYLILKSLCLRLSLAAVLQGLCLVSLTVAINRLILQLYAVQSGPSSTISSLYIFLQNIGNQALMSEDVAGPGTLCTCTN